MVTLEFQQITHKQMEGIKNRAIDLWGDNWLAQLVREYERVTESKPRTKFAQVQRYFTQQSTPNLDTMNALLLALNCKFRMECFDKRTIEF